MADTWFLQVGADDFLLAGVIGFGPWAVLQVLRWHAREKTSCYPSIKTIAEMLGIPERTAQYHLSNLESRGMVRREQQRGKATIYHLLGTAITCTPSDGRDAKSCGQPTQDLASGGARSCGQPTQDLAAKEEEGKDEIKDEVKKKARGRAAAVVAIPERLDCEEFREAWARWSKHRKEIHKTLTPSTSAAQMKELAAWGLARGVAAINYSIKKGWTGLFEESSNGRNHNGSSAAGGVEGSARIRSGKALPDRHYSATAAKAPTGNKVVSTKVPSGRSD
jgi:DNA-binding transcriptional ArsR family regulator